MGLLDGILGGGMRRGGGMSPITMALLGLLAYKTMKGKNLSAIFGGGATGGQNGGLGGLLPRASAGCLVVAPRAAFSAADLAICSNSSKITGLATRLIAGSRPERTSRSSHQNLNVRLAKNVFLG